MPSREPKAVFGTASSTTGSIGTATAGVRGNHTQEPNPIVIRYWASVFPAVAFVWVSPFIVCCVENEFIETSTRHVRTANKPSRVSPWSRWTALGTLVRSPKGCPKTHMAKPAHASPFENLLQTKAKRLHGYWAKAGTRHVVDCTPVSRTQTKRTSSSMSHTGITIVLKSTVTRSESFRAGGLLFGACKGQPIGFDSPTHHVRLRCRCGCHWLSSLRRARLNVVLLAIGFLMWWLARRGRLATPHQRKMKAAWVTKAYRHN